MVHDHLPALPLSQPVAARPLNRDDRIAPGAP